MELLDVEWIKVAVENTDDPTGYFDRGSRVVTVEEASDCTLAAEVGCLCIGPERSVSTGTLVSEAATEILRRNRNVSVQSWAATKEWMKLAISRSRLILTNETKS